MNLHETHSILALISLAVFVLAYLIVASEEYTHIRKSKPVILASGIIWFSVAYLAIYHHGYSKIEVQELIKSNLTDYGELLLFLLVSMTYTNALVERNVFEKIRYTLSLWGLSYRKIFWLTGLIAFFMSAIANNLTTAMVMGAVVLACAKGNSKFIQLSFINIVVAANAGGVFSPFGDVTTLMMWQSGKIEFFGFFDLLLPAMINFFVPAALLSFFIPSLTPVSDIEEPVELKKGAFIISILFFATIAIAVVSEQVLYIPPFMGMMMGLVLLMILSIWLKKTGQDDADYDVFVNIKDAEWDTLFFFYGVIFCIGGLAVLGYLEWASLAIYSNLSPTSANVFIGVLSAVVDNIPVMFAVLEMQPPMDMTQWLLVTLTSGVGGSLLAIGSAAGVALMGQSKGHYSFIGHLKWSPLIALGYGASIYIHLLIQS